jgi:hypothetical protein
MEEREMTLDEAVEKIIEIGKRFELQGKLAEESARIERERNRQRQGTNAPTAAAPGPGR